MRVLVLGGTAFSGPHVVRRLYEAGHAAQHWVVDTMRIHRELGCRETVPRDEALRRTVEWERTNPPQQVDPARFDYAAEDAVLAWFRTA